VSLKDGKKAEKRKKKTKFPCFIKIFRFSAKFFRVLKTLKDGNSVFYKKNFHKRKIFKKMTEILRKFLIYQFFRRIKRIKNKNFKKNKDEYISDL